ncbi:36687_t:CDS:1, partial [Racocetra persica]
KQVIFNGFENNFFGATDYELESLFPGVLGFEIGTVFGASSFELPPGLVTLNFTIPGPVNSELCGSVGVELLYGPVNSELCGSVGVELPFGLVNPEYNNSKLCGSVDVELSLDLEPGSVDVELPPNLVLGSVDVELPPDLVPSSVNVESLSCLVNPEYDSTWSGSEDFELS